MEENKSDVGSSSNSLGMKDMIVKICEATPVLPAVRRNGILKTKKELRDKMDRLGTVFGN